MNKVQTVDQFNKKYNELLDYGSELGIDHRDLVPSVGIYQNLNQYFHISFQSYLSLLDSYFEHEVIEKIINKDIKHVHSVLNNIKENELQEQIKDLKYDDDSQYEILDSFDAFSNDIIKIKETFEHYQLNPNIPFYINQDEYQITMFNNDNLKEILENGTKDLKRGIIDYDKKTSELVLNKFQELFVNTNQKQR